MGDRNQMDFVRKHAALFRGPLLEIGSKDYGNTPDYRSALGIDDYTGVDLEAGANVSTVLDLTLPFAVVDERLGGKRFRSVICASVLEHCRNPFAMCGNISALVPRGGVVYVSVPFTWRIHGYPSDYWRFTADGVKVLLPDFHFDGEQACLSSWLEGETAAVDAKMLAVDLDVPTAAAEQSRSRGTLLRLAKRLKVMGRLFTYPYLFPPVMINMIGVKT